MAQARVALRGDEWRQALAGNFNGLVPDRPAATDPAGASGWLAAAMLGDVAAFHVAGSGQVLRRSPAQARRQPSDLLKVCIQRSGSAAIQQGDREVLLAPGSMAIYDIDQPYRIRLQGDWRCAVIAFPRSALVASRRFIDDLICRPAQVADGPGSVLVPLVASAVGRDGRGGLGSGASGALMGRASIDLLMAALTEQQLPGRPDAVRMQVDAYLQAHLADPGLSHQSVAAAHHMSGRTLHRLFGEPGPSVTELIRSYRLDRIRTDLSAPASAGLPISRITARWGLHDMPHFSRVFRARYGMTPSQARRDGASG